MEALAQGGVQPSPSWPRYIVVFHVQPRTTADVEGRSVRRPKREVCDREV